MSTTVLERYCTITVKGQTTVPKPVREALGVDRGGRIAFRLDADRHVTLHRADEVNDTDPAIGAFLAFLAADIGRRPEAISSLPPALRARIMELTEGIDVDLEEPIEGDVDL